MRIEIKPLSVNEAWKGRRFRTDKYKKYKSDLLKLLPKMNLPPPPYEIHFKFGFSSASSDWDNPIKPTQDVLASFYKFNDKLIKKAFIEVEQVPKGKEFFEFNIKALS